MRTIHVVIAPRPRGRGARGRTPSSSLFVDPTDQQWIFVSSTKLLMANRARHYEIGLNDGTKLDFSFGLG